MTGSRSLAVLAVVLLAGCATPPEQPGHAPSPAPAPFEIYDELFELAGELPYPASPGWFLEIPLDGAAGRAFTRANLTAHLVEANPKAQVFAMFVHVYVNGETAHQAGLGSGESTSAVIDLDPTDELTIQFGGDQLDPTATYNLRIVVVANPST